jgi:hypothetical protein
LLSQVAPDADVRISKKEDDMKKAGSLLVLLAMAACGSDSPTSPDGPVPQVAGRYNGYPAWLVQWNRSRDGRNN